jgi:hypothetical protein
MMAAILAAGILLAGLRGMPSPIAAGSSADPALCVSTVLPAGYYQAVAEMSACTGRPVVVEAAPADIPWGFAGELPPPGADRTIIVDP